MSMLTTATLATTATPHWTPTGRQLHSTTDTVGITFALTLANSSDLPDHLLKISDPTSSVYGQYLTTAQINRLYPTVEATAAEQIQTWIHNTAPTAVVDVSAHGFVVATIPVFAVSELFSVKLVEYTHSSSSSGSHTVIRAASTSTSTHPPAAIAHLVDFISGLDYFPVVARKALTVNSSHKSAAASNTLGVDPPSLRSRYQIGDIMCTHPNTTQATANFLGEGYSDDDLRFFFEVFYPSSAGQKVSKVVGQNNDPSLEASLDIQYISSIGFGAETWWISDDDEHDQQEPFLAYMVLLSKTPDTPLVHSISYADMAWSEDVAYTNRVDLEFIKAGLRGISILVASGDDGAGCSNSTTSFVVEWPSSSPYITAVGATTMPPSAAAAVESTASLSGGGFSKHYPQPSWQKEAVASYVKELSTLGKAAPPSSFYNASGRAVPDVSCMGTLFSIIVSQQPSVVSGTSASTPTWAGIVSLLNDARFHQKLPSMGFLNPWLYANGASFRDIATGTSSPGGMVSSTCGEAQNGWPATVGYDLGTGLGVPNFEKLKAAALKNNSSL
jgi:tripeptidyl-peptidase-1